jgi:ABC-type branched-subunit amino acid transport system substrate-binding protein
MTQHSPFPLFSRARKRPGGDPLVFGLFVPQSGVAGIWGPSAVACATLAAEDINRAGGVCGRELRLELFDASDECCDLGELTRDAIDDGRIHAIVGMHTSSVRCVLSASSRGRIPYVYTALHEGVERSSRLYTIGETPERQLRPAIDLLVHERGARRWMLIGNDYIWPRVSHRMAARYVAQAGGEVLADRYLPLGGLDIDGLLEAIEFERPDALLLSLVGQDSVDFNRAFGASDLARRTLRLSCAIEENMLLAIGADASENLFSVSGYFGALSDDTNMCFKERYHQRFGARAPTLNSLGQSNFEGVHFAAALARSNAVRQDGSLAFTGVRGIAWRANDDSNYPVHLAQADGHLFRVVNSF